MKYYCVYIIWNTVNEHIYIGQHKYTDTTNPLGNYWGSGTHLRRAQAKYGRDTFKRAVLLEGLEHRSDADEWEKILIAAFRSVGSAEYNIAVGGHYDHQTLQDSHKQHISETLKEYYKTHKPWNYGMHVASKLKGLKRSEEFKEHLREVTYFRTEECRKAVSQRFKGVPKPEEQRRKMSESAKGRHKGWKWILKDGKRLWVKPGESLNV